MFKTIILLILIILLNSCIAMPVMNTAIPMKEGEERTTLSGGIWTYDKDVIPVVYGSLQYQYENINFELNTFGSRISETLYKGNNIYMVSFQSIYLTFMGLGLNTGFIFSLSANDVNLYLSGRIDGIKIFSDGMQNLDEKHLYITPSLGLSHKINNSRLFAEFVVLIPVVNEFSDYKDKETKNRMKGYGNNIYSFQLGLSF